MINTLRHYFLARFRSFSMGFQNGSGHWEGTILFLLLLPSFYVSSAWIWNKWTWFSGFLIQQGGENLLQQVSKIMVGISLLLSLPSFLTVTYHILYPRGEISFLRSLPIHPIQLFSIRFLFSFFFLGGALFPAFFLSGAAYWRNENLPAVGWLGVGWILLSLGSTSLAVLMAIALGRLKSGRFARFLSEGLLFIAMVVLILLFFWIDFYAREERLVQILTGWDKTFRPAIKILSLYVVPQGGMDSLCLLGGGMMSLFFFAIAAWMDNYALERGWGAPWTPERTAKSPAWSPQLSWVPQQTRGFLIKEIPEIQKNFLVLVILLLFVAIGYLGLDKLAHFSTNLSSMPLEKKLRKLILPYWFFLFIVPMVTVLISITEEKKGIPFLRTLPISLSKILWLKFWIHWSPMLLCFAFLSIFMAWYRFFSLVEACGAFGIAIPLSAGVVLWALLIGGWFKSPPGKELGMLPIMVYLFVIMLPVLVLKLAMEFFHISFSLQNVGWMGSIVFLLWIAPLPGIWKWVILRWEEETI